MPHELAHHQPNRRDALRLGVWSAPVIVLAAATPATAASDGPMISFDQPYYQVSKYSDGSILVANLAYLQLPAAQNEDVVVSFTFTPSDYHLVEGPTVVMSAGSTLLQLEILSDAAHVGAPAAFVADAKGATTNKSYGTATANVETWSTMRFGATHYDATYGDAYPTITLYWDYLPDPLTDLTLMIVGDQAFDDGSQERVESLGNLGGSAGVNFAAGTVVPADALPGMIGVLGAKAPTFYFDQTDSPLIRAAKTDLTVGAIIGGFIWNWDDPATKTYYMGSSMAKQVTLDITKPIPQTNGSLTIRLVNPSDTSTETPYFQFDTGDRYKTFDYADLQSTVIITELVLLSAGTVPGTSYECFIFIEASGYTTWPTDTLATDTVARVFYPG